MPLNNKNAPAAGAAPQTPLEDQCPRPPHLPPTLLNPGYATATESTLVAVHHHVHHSMRGSAMQC